MPQAVAKLPTSGAQGATVVEHTPEDYRAFQAFLEEASGIVLGPGKEYLVTSRLTRLIREYGFASLAEMSRALQGGANSRLRTDVIDAMTTNETFWFRDPAHFRILTEEILPAARNGRLRIWSAACSSGQEPYSLSMAVQDFLQRNPGRLAGGVEILGTDIAQSVLNEARQGVYCGMAAARGLSDEQRQRYFSPDGDCLSVRHEIRQRVLFREFNLTRGFDILGRFDVIFCRNVLIYFSSEMKREILGRMARILNPGGHLLLGSTESLTGHSTDFEMRSAHGGIAYRRK
jgi:chemotaxis protein methyltransferase CheR